jgi:hypothetical protein
VAAAPVRKRNAPLTRHSRPAIRTLERGTRQLVRQRNQPATILAVLVNASRVRILPGLALAPTHGTGATTMRTKPKHAPALRSAIPQMITARLPRAILASSAATAPHSRNATTLAPAGPRSRPARVPLRFAMPIIPPLAPVRAIASCVHRARPPVTVQRVYTRATPTAVAGAPLLTNARTMAI